MKLLALDTSSIACSVALQIGSTITERHEEQAREHTRLLIPMISAVLEDAGTTLTSLDAIVLGNGPGSFIGMRIAASVAQGLAFGANLKIVPISSLAAVAAQVFKEQDADEVVVAQDAHMQEVYLGVYRRAADDLPEVVTAEFLQAQAPIASLTDERTLKRVAAGSGWQRYPDLLAANQHHFSAVLDVPHPRARFLLSLGAKGLAAGDAIDAVQVMPAYLRDKVAEPPSRP